MNGVVSIADALAFESWPAEQQRIAEAGLALREKLRVEHAAGYEEGFEAARHIAAREHDTPVGYLVVDHARYDAWLDALQLFRQSFSPADTRYLKLGELIAEFARLRRVEGE